MILIADIEADGFLDVVTQAHCLVLKDRETQLVYKFYGEESVPGVKGSLECGLNFMSKATTVVGHNFIGYDLPVLAKLYGYQFDNEVVDTLILSRILSPDRRLPRGCPGSIPNPVTGKNDRIGPHSLHAWGYRVSKSKPAHHDWATFSPEMLNRCEQDVHITDRVLTALMQENQL